VIQEFLCVCGKRLSLSGAIGATGMLQRLGWTQEKDGDWSCSKECRARGDADKEWRKRYGHESGFVKRT
jgi:hypothetical protein